MPTRQKEPAGEDTVGHDDRCEASRPGPGVPCRCAERAAVALLTSLGYEVEEPPAAHRYERVQVGNRQVLRCVDCPTIWRSPASRPPTNPCIPRPPTEPTVERDRPVALREVRLAIVGSTRFAGDPEAAATARRHIANAIAALHPDVVVSGGAKGIDEIAADYAREHRIPVVEHLPANRRWAPDGYKDRNLAIAADCTHLLCIRHERSKTYGSGWTADRAEEMGKHVERLTVQAGTGSQPARPRRARKSARTRSATP